MADIPGSDRLNRIDDAVWRILQPSFLGTDEPAPVHVRRILVGDLYRPDSFTVSERLAGPAWLDRSERDPETWLRRLVDRRLPAGRDVSTARRAALGQHVLGETWRVLGMRLGDQTVADTLWDQEVPYLIDRIAGWCLHRRPARSLNTAAAARTRGRAFATQFLARYADRLNRLDLVTLTRITVAAGLIGLDEHDRSPQCTPISLPRSTADSPGRAAVWRRLAGYGDTAPAVDHVDELLDRLTTGRVSVVWWPDGLIETAFDLLLIQRLIAVNPRLRVTVVPKKGRHDDAAEHADVIRLLRHPDLEPLRSALASGQLSISRHGPRMATANPVKLHATVIDTVAASDVMICRGGRVHEMFSGNLDVPMFTAYVVAESFLEAQAGVDSTTAPVMVFGTVPGEWAWWGFRGRAERTLTLASGRTVPACHTTVAEHFARARMIDPGQFLGDLARLVSAWPALRDRYRDAAYAEIRRLHEVLAPYAGVLLPSDAPALRDARSICVAGGG